MDTIQGLIQGVSTNTGVNRNGKPYTRWVFTINEKKYSTFDEKIGNAYKVGDNVVLTGEQKGAFWNMNTMSLASQTALPQVTTSTPKGVPIGNDLVVDLLRQILAELKGITTPKEVQPIEVQPIEEVVSEDGDSEE